MDYQGDMDLINAILDIADLPTASETPGVASDQDFDLMICLARRIAQRDGLKRW